jgi:two-component sensor histidine kinase
VYRFVLQEMNMDGHDGQPHNGNSHLGHPDLRMPPDDPGAIFREANHRIANNLSLIAALVRLNAADLGRDKGVTLSGPEVALRFNEIAARITTVGRLHRLLTDQTSVRLLDLGEHLRETCRALVTSLSPSGQLTLDEDVATGCAARPDQILPVAFIVSEMVTNAIKYAHPTGVSGSIRLTCQKRAGGGVVITVTDDGVGLPEGFDPKKDGGIGFRTMRMLADQLGAEMCFASDSLGCRLQLEIPDGAH